VYKGDISNDVPKRILVVADVFTQVTEVETKSKIFFKKTTQIRKFNRGLLSKLYLVANNSSFVFEMVSFGMSEEDLIVSFNNLEREGTNPFRYCNAYEDVKELIKDLPFRPEVSFVVDIPTRKGMYGHWGLDVTEL
jgi:hypothetical protein